MENSNFAALWQKIWLKMRDSTSDQRNRYTHRRCNFIPHILVIVSVCYPAVVDLKLMGLVASKVLMEPDIPANKFRERHKKGGGLMTTSTDLQMTMTMMAKNIFFLKYVRFLAYTVYILRKRQFIMSVITV